MKTKKELQEDFNKKLEELKKLEEHRLKLVGQVQALHEILNPKKEEKKDVSPKV